MRRREFIGLLVVPMASRPFIALTQVSPKRPLVAVLHGTSQATSEPFRSALREGLQELGYVEGRDYDIEYRAADGDPTRLPTLANELIRLRPNVVVVGSSVAALAVKQASASTPIVTAGIFDPVRLGLAASIARPEGTVTGIWVSVDTLAGKYLELGLELVPGAKLVGMLIDVSSPPSASLRRGVEIAAQGITIELFSVEVRAPVDIDIAFHTLTRERVNLVIALGGPLLFNERRRIAELAIAAQLPTVHAFRENVEAGGLVSYGADVREHSTCGSLCGQDLERR
jgi:putative tryptophan/tyrosine transport system substrate-binding protein